LAVDYDVTIVGSGPYGLSAAAHLRDIGLTVSTFGEPMSFWVDTMPEGMLLRSPRCASTISDPHLAYTLEAFEKASGTPARAPVPLSTFVSYGRWFQQQLGVPNDRRSVTAITRVNSHFQLTLNDGERLSSRRVVIAAGIGSFQARPPEFARLAPQHVSHCYDGPRVGDFAGRRVAVVGAGQSALECATLLGERGADVEVIARIDPLRWIGRYGFLHRLGPISSLLYSKHDVGPMGISRLVAYPKLLFYCPSWLREKIRRRAIRAAGAPWLRSRLGPVRITTGRRVALAESSGRNVRLRLDDGSERRVDHVLLGTGYRINVARYDFLAPALLADLRCSDGWPILSAGFSSSIPGLHFVGAAAARSYGPLLHFVAGTTFASRELSTSLKRSGARG
jgi:lysine/ornithine N-monooxygenase